MGTMLRVLLVLVLLLPPGPAAADGPDAGVVIGTAAVGKVPVAACGPGGAAAVAGPGLGFPVVNAPKMAFFAFAGVATTVLHGTGPLLLCGDLYPVAGNLPFGGVGAACGMSKGVGQGTFAFPGTVAHPGPGVLFLSDVQWKASVGGHLVVTGNFALGPMPPAVPVGTVVSLLVAQGGAGCATKTDGPPKAGGATAFNVVGPLAFVPGVLVDPNVLLPKCPAFPPCLYGGPK